MLSIDFSREIIAWYHYNKRKLPWRDTNDPYTIWLSEIILQQTRVEQGLPYFHKFLEAYPTVHDLAAANEDDVLKLWQGLGYYSRGRNLHRSARIVMEEHQGYFPKSYEELIKLNGVGAYTAAAIASFATNEAKAVVDGNVFRVLTRYFGINEPINSTKGKKIIYDLANTLLNKKQPAIHNQAIMEFGALQCKPKSPNCSACPVQAGCQAYRFDLVKYLPLKIKPKESKIRYFNYVVAEHEGGILMRKRVENDIWKNLYELPLFETDTLIDHAKLINIERFSTIFGRICSSTLVYGPIKHILSHQKIIAQFIVITPYENNLSPSKGYFYQPLEKLEQLAKPKLIFDFLKSFYTLKK